MSAKLKITRGSGNDFRDIGFGAEAENLKLRSYLMMRIEDHFKKSGATQAATAKALGPPHTEGMGSSVGTHSYVVSRPHSAGSER